MRKLLLILVLIIMSCPIMSTALTLRVGSGSGQPGDVIVISITLDDASNVEDFGFTLEYDTDVLELDKVEDGAATSDWPVVEGVEISGVGVTVAGSALFVGSSVDGSNQEICEVHLEIKSSAPGGVEPLEATSLSADIDGATVVDGSITISSTTPTPTPTPSPSPTPPGTPTPTPTPTITPTPTPALQTLKVGSVTGSADEDVVVLVHLDTTSVVTMWSFELTFDTVNLQYISVEKGAAVFDWDIVSGTASGSGVSLVGLAGSGVAMQGNNLEICKITLHIDASASNGIYPLNAQSLGSDIAGASVDNGAVSVNDWVAPVTFDFESDTQAWSFVGNIDPYDSPVSSYSSGMLGLSPDGSSNCFSFWSSPEVLITQGQVYLAQWTVMSSVSDPDMAVEFRLRANQTGNWTSWTRSVASYNNASPTSSAAKVYDMILAPDMDTASDNIQFAFDVLGFNPGDDLSSWLYLDTLDFQEVTIVP
jgi:hypothetical protein